MLTCLVPVLFTFYIQGVLKLEKYFRRQKVKYCSRRISELEISWGTKVIAVSQLEEYDMQLWNRRSSVGIEASSKFMYFTLVFLESVESGVTRDRHLLAAYGTLT